MDQYNDVYAVPGAISWAELTTPDTRAATAFYGSLFGWTFEDMNVGTGAYHVFKVGGTSMGGVMSPPPGAPPMSSWGVYVTVANAEATAEQCQALGGKLLAGPFDVPSVGRMVVLQDPQGAVFSAIAYNAG
jgi:uncharacterized protein